MDMHENHDPEASIMLWELQTRDLVLGGTKQSFAVQLGMVWHSVQEQDLRGQSLPSCGREEGGCHLPLPSTDLLPGQAVGGAGEGETLYSPPLSGSQELLLTRKVRVPLENSHGWSVPSGDLKRQFEAYLSVMLFKKHFSTCVPRITLSRVRHLSFRSGR